MAWLIDQLNEGAHLLRRPVTTGQLSPRAVRIGRAADEGNDLVDVCHCDGKANQDMGPLSRLAEFIGRAPGDDLLSEVHEGRQDILQIHHLRAAVVDRQRVDPERSLQR